MNINYSEIDASGDVRQVSEEELRKRLAEKWYAWLTEVGRIAGWSPEKTADHVNDPNWFACFDDGMSAKEAVDEARSKGVITQ
jgi:hypothetical protein